MKAGEGAFSVSGALQSSENHRRANGQEKVWRAERFAFGREIADLRRSAALLLGHIFPICSLVAPCAARISFSRSRKPIGPLGDDNLRIVLSLKEDPEQSRAMDMIDEKSCFCQPGETAPVVVGTNEVGSFGWWLKGLKKYLQVDASPKGKAGCRIIDTEKSVEYWICDRDGVEMDFPG